MKKSMPKTQKLIKKIKEKWNVRSIECKREMGKKKTQGGKSIQYTSIPSDVYISLVH